MAVYQQASPAGVQRWMVDFVWVDSATGKKRRIRRAAKDAKGRAARSQTAAEKAENEIRSALAAGTFEVATELTADGVATLADYRETYFADARVRLKPQTMGHLEKVYRTLLPILGATPLDQIDATAIAGLTRALHERERSAKTINNTLSVLRATLAHAEEHHVIAAIPRVRWQKVPPSTFDFFTFEEAAKMVEHGTPMVVLGLRTGMRIGELLALRWGDVSLDRKQISVSRSLWWGPGGEKHEGAPKNNRSRPIPLTSDALAALESLNTEREGTACTAYVFADVAGSPLTPGACKWPLWTVQDATGLRRTGCHVLRHTFASHLAMRGVPLPAIQALMGHSTIQMTMKYAHLAPDHLRSAISALEG